MHAGLFVADPVIRRRPHLLKKMEKRKEKETDNKQKKASVKSYPVCCTSDPFLGRKASLLAEYGWFILNMYNTSSIKACVVRD